MQNAIDLSWKGTADGSLPLPIEYGDSRARGMRGIYPMILALFYLRGWGLFCCEVIAKMAEALDDIDGGRKSYAIIVA